MKSLLIGEHASDRLQERKIMRVDVENAIRESSGFNSGKRGRLKAVKKLNGRKLVVFYREIPRLVFLESAYWRKP